MTLAVLPMPPFAVLSLLLFAFPGLSRKTKTSGESAAGFLRMSGFSSSVHFSKVLLCRLVDLLDVLAAEVCQGEELELSGARHEHHADLL